MNLPPEFAMGTELERLFISKMLRVLKVRAVDGLVIIECRAGTFHIHQRGSSQNHWLTTMVTQSNDPKVAWWWRVPEPGLSRLALLQSWVNWWNLKFATQDEQV